MICNDRKSRIDTLMYEDFFEASRVESMLGTSHFVSGSSHMSFFNYSLSISSYFSIDFGT